MRKKLDLLVPLAAMGIFILGTVMSGCSTTTTTSGPTGTNVVTTVKGIDAATLAEIDAALAQAAKDAPTIAASIAAVSSSLHAAPTVTVTNK